MLTLTKATIKQAVRKGFEACGQGLTRLVKTTDVGEKPKEGKVGSQPENALLRIHKMHEESQPLSKQSKTAVKEEKNVA